MSPRRTDRTWIFAWGVLFASSAVLTAALGLTLGASHRDEHRASAEDVGWFASAFDDGASSAARAVALAQADELLAQHAEGLVTGKSVAQAGAPLSSLQYWIPSASAPSLAELATGSFDAEVVSQYRLDVDPVLVRRTVAATFTLGRDGWRIGEVASSGKDLWSYGPVTSARAGRSLVVGSEVYAERTDSLATQVESARSDVDDFWTHKWPARVVVILPGKAQWMDGLIGDAAASKFPAVATRDSGREGTVNRITVNPTVFDGLPYVGQQIILRHEITHVAQNAFPGQQAVPLWLAEGLATYVGYQGSGVPDDVVGRLVFGEVRSAGTPTGLPSDREFDFDRSARERGLAYEEGWSVCAMIAEEFGEERLVSFYASVADGEGGARARVNTAAQQVLGVSADELQSRWQSWLQANA